MRTCGAILMMALAICADGLDHVLAVVEDQQGAAVPEVRAHRLQQRPIGLFAHAEHLRRLADDQRRVADRRQVEEPHAVGKVVDLLRRDLQRQARLAQPAHADQGQQARCRRAGS